MATLALSMAGQAVGAALGGPAGALVGRALGALAGNALDQALFGEKTPAQAPEIRLSGSAEGGGIPRLYGWARVAGNIIWASALEKLPAEQRGGKGGGSSSDERILASFALGLAQGPVTRLGRIWADGDLLDPREVTLRFYPGTETQTPDSLIVARQGAGNAPAYRGLCYIVFERLPLERFGNRIPNITVELCRLAGELEPAIRSVTVIPGATEFGYDPVPRLRLLGAGQSTGENQHQSALASDWTLSIDDLVSLAPNLDHVSLVVAWFGTDLRASACEVRPAVEGRNRTVKGTSWAVAGLTRDTAPLLSVAGGGPAYGGTPSDAAVRAAIRDLKARGIRVTLYPMMLMDIPANNPMGQPAYPWRGRIAVSAAAEGKPSASAEIASFMGNGSDWRYRRFIRHYAALARDEGCESLLIGSEMAALSIARSGPQAFPFVDALVLLAREIKALAPGLQLTYAADWTEYAGLQPATEPGTKIFHLDPLWAAPEIAAIGIDYYMPVADWRDGTDHPDRANRDTPYGLDYLKGNITGGEGFDWYYASDTDRERATRTPIRDGAYGEDWIWRIKDIESFWSRPHYNRVGGVRAATPTAWVPRSKPVWFTELGAGAVDKAANEPNKFADPKSSENGRPVFSSGAPDALAQRQVLRAHLAYWATKPDMVSRVTLWTWDARPFPAFPYRTDLWSDGANHATGHWLTGRLGALASDELARALGRDFGLSLDADMAAPLISGLVLDGTASARDALDLVARATGLVIAEMTGGIRLVRRPEKTATTITTLADEGAPRRRLVRADRAERPGRLVLSFADRERDYASAAVSAALPEGGPVETVASGLVLETGAARQVAETLLLSRLAGEDRIEVSLPPALLALDPGDLLRFEGPELYEITEIRDARARKIVARKRPALVPVSVSPARAPVLSRPVVAGGEPALFFGQVPGLPQTPAQTRLLFAAFMSPWPGEVTVLDADTGAQKARLTRPAALGELLSPLPVQSLARRHPAPVEITLYGGHVASVDPLALFAGSNRLALKTPLGLEVLGFENADLIAPGRYRLSGLLRGLLGTEGAMAALSPGTPLVVLDEAVLVDQTIDPGRVGDALPFIAFAGQRDGTGTPQSVATTLAPLLPLAPAHPRAKRKPDGSLVLSWCRRSRADPEGWASEPPLEFAAEAYRLEILAGDRLLRRADVAAPAFVYDVPAQRADFGTPAPAFRFRVAQLSPTLGPGPQTEGQFNG